MPIVHLSAHPGQRVGTSINVDEDHYQYHKKGNGSYRCASYTHTKCPVTIVLDGNAEHFRRGDHNHTSPGEEALQIQGARDRCKRLAATGNGTPKTIFHQVRSELNDVPLAFTAGLERSMQQQRARVNPNNPATVEEAHVLIFQTDLYRKDHMDRPFYQGLVTSDDGYQGLVFVSDSLINMLATNNDMQINTVVSPCGHLLCSRCATRMMETRPPVCYVCRQDCFWVTKLYL